jgi:hypothetical protein
MQKISASNPEEYTVLKRLDSLETMLHRYFRNLDMENSLRSTKNTAVIRLSIRVLDAKLFDFKQFHHTVSTIIHNKKAVSGLRMNDISKESIDRIVYLSIDIHSRIFDSTVKDIVDKLKFLTGEGFEIREVITVV